MNGAIKIGYDEKGNMYLVSGFHRIEAARRLQIPVERKKGGKKQRKKG